MKKCSNCGREFPDNVKFCVNCGKPLGQAEQVQQPMPSQNQNYQQSAPGYGYNQVPPNNMPVNNVPAAAPNTKSSSKGKLIIIITILLLVSVGGGVAIFLVTRGGDKSSPEGTVAQTQATAAPTTGSDSDGDPSGDAENGNDIDGDDGDTDLSTPEPVESQSPVTELDLTKYQEYYDSVEATFGKFIMSGAQSGQYSAFREGLGNALNTRDVQSCEYNFGKLKELEESVEKSSKQTIRKLKKRISKLGKKSGAKKAKSGAAFIKNQTVAEIAEDSGDYKKAKAKYNKCIKILQKAIKKSGKGKSNGGGLDDDYYRTRGDDDYTFDILCSRRLSDSEVRALSANEKRYYMNTLFATYGYRFNNDTIQDFFNRQSWYEPDYNIRVGDQQTVKSYFSNIAEYNYRKLGGV